jgi:hypothetical protein
MFFMKRFAAFALLFVGIALPACAQHGSAHGGFSGHGATAFHGGSFSAPRRAPGVTRYSGARPFTASRGYTPPAAGVRRPYRGPWRYRRPYRSPYTTGFTFAAPGFVAPGFVEPGYAGYPYGDDSYDSTDAQAAPDAQPYGQSSPQEQGPPEMQQLPDQAQDRELPRWPYGGAAQPASAPAQSAPAAPAEDAVTLIFKDGRPPQQIRNYILTRDTLYIGDHHPDIAVNELDLAATVKANRDAGVDFRLPGDLR